VPTLEAEWGTGGAGGAARVGVVAAVVVADVVAVVGEGVGRWKAGLWDDVLKSRGISFVGVYGGALLPLSCAPEG